MLFLCIPLGAQTYLDSVSLSIQDQADTTKTKRFMAAFGHLIHNDIEQARLAADSSYKYAVRSGVCVRIGWSLEHQGNYYFLQNRLDTALEIYHRAYEYLRTCDNPTALAGVLINIANCYGEQGDFLAAQKTYLRSLTIQDSAGITGYHRATNLVNLGTVYSDLENHREALRYARMAREVYHELGDEFAVAEVDFNIACTLLDIDSVEAAQQMFNQLEEYHRKNEHVYYLIDVLILQAQIAYTNDNYLKSEAILLEALDKAKQNNDESIYLRIYHDFKELYLRKGDLDKAEEYALKSLAYTKKSGNRLDLSEDYKGLSDLYRDKKDYSKAYEFRVLYDELQDSVYAIERIKEVAGLKEQYESIRKDAEIKALNQEVRINKLYTIIFGLGLVGSLTAIVLGFLWFRQKEKNEKMTRDAKEQKLERELEYKRKELTAQTLHLVQKNTFLQNITQRVDILRDSADNHRNEIHKLLSSLKLEPELDKDWESFKSYFIDVHNDFDEKLKRCNPSLNENDQRLAYLIRMQLNASEIAAVMRVLPESVRKSKYRLKKKLNLSKDQDLAKFLMAL